MYTLDEVIDIEFDNPEAAIQVAYEVLWQEMRKYISYKEIAIVLCFYLKLIYKSIGNTEFGRHQRHMWPNVFGFWKLKVLQPILAYYVNMMIITLIFIVIQTMKNFTLCYSMDILSSKLMLAYILPSSLAIEIDSIAESQYLTDNITLVSQDGTFELGFFSLGNSPKCYYLRIWYKKMPGQTVVWVANSEKPIDGTS
ncbi:hypothetical protein PIB30_051538 [Stylosanthes scabra]|uniref:Bulb-type lectin domain-containing protein n=1 Tax=Stylosanthes scabra TaxID=79078 RepID=A0ABU6VH58_9FABA|nr:hypothetical protein [Stylosanthes scabra]